MIQAIMCIILASQISWIIYYLNTPFGVIEGLTFIERKARNDKLVVPVLIGAIVFMLLGFLYVW